MWCHLGYSHFTKSEIFKNVSTYYQCILCFLVKIKQEERFNLMKLNLLQCILHPISCIVFFFGYFVRTLLCDINIMPLIYSRWRWWLMRTICGYWSNPFVFFFGRSWMNIVNRNIYCCVNVNIYIYNILFWCVGLNVNRLNIVDRNLWFV